MTRRYLADGDRPAVDLELSGTNQRGAITTPAPRRSCCRAAREARAASRSARRRDRPPGRARRDRGGCSRAGEPHRRRAMSAAGERIAIDAHTTSTTRSRSCTSGPSSTSRRAGATRRDEEATRCAPHDRAPTTRRGTRCSVPPDSSCRCGSPSTAASCVGAEVASAMENELRPHRLHRLNPLGLNNTAAALFAWGTEDQRRRFLPPIVRNEERWCQLFSEPGAGSDLASLATRAERDGDEWVITGQKVWTTWADESDFAILLARTNPVQPKNRGITYFLLDLHQPGVDIRPLRHITASASSTRCSSTLCGCPTPIASARSTTAGESARRRCRANGRWLPALVRVASGASAARAHNGSSRWCGPVARRATRSRVNAWSRSGPKSRSEAGRTRGAGQPRRGQSPGAAASVGKVHQPA